REKKEQAPAREKSPSQAPRRGCAFFLPPRSLMTHLTPHSGKQFLFVLLSVADLALTWWLLAHSRGQVYEANPVARWWLQQQGWLGLALFKVGVVFLVVGLVVVIARSQPRTAGCVLGLGCVVLALVVLHSTALCRTVLRSPQKEHADMVR